MARQSHSSLSMWSVAAVAVFGLSLSGCLASDPSQYEEREQTVPVLDALRANPPLTEILRKSEGDLVNITVPVRSEDRGEDLAALLYLNFATQDQSFLTGITLTAATFEERREISIAWTVSTGLTGCNQLSLVVTHASNVDRWDNTLMSDEGAALITWWLDINNSGDTLDNCPSNLALDAGVGR